MKKNFKFDFTANVLKSAEARKALEKTMESYFKNRTPEFINRLAKVPPYITDDIGIYTELLDEAKLCYQYGLYHATVAMIGITAERFAVELEDKLRVKLKSSRGLSDEDIFNKPYDQKSRLVLLKKAGMISNEVWKNLDNIRFIRNKHTHPDEKIKEEEDALKMLKLFIEVINSMFSEKYVFKNGKIVERK